MMRIIYLFLLTIILSKLCTVYASEQYIKDNNKVSVFGGKCVHIRYNGIMTNTLHYLPSTAIMHYNIKQALQDKSDVLQTGTSDNIFEPTVGTTFTLAKNNVVINANSIFNEYYNLNSTQCIDSAQALFMSSVRCESGIHDLTVILGDEKWRSEISSWAGEPLTKFKPLLLEAGFNALILNCKYDENIDQQSNQLKFQRPISCNYNFTIDNYPPKFSQTSHCCIRTRYTKDDDNSFFRL